MLYIVLLSALLCLTIKGYCGKRLSCFVRDTGDTYLFNLLRMLFCIIIGIALVFLEQSQSFLLPEGKMIAICMLSGFSNAAFLVCWMLAIRKNSMVSVDVSLTLGSLIPSILCMILFAEPISITKMLGFGLIVLATAILGSGKKKESRSGLLGAILLTLAAVGDGMSGFAQQLYKQYYTETGSHANGIFYPKTIFHLYTYLFAALLLLLILVYYRIFMAKKANATENSEVKRSVFAISPRAVTHIAIMAICLFAANYFQTVATGDYGMSSQMLYPIIKGGCLITVNFTAMLCFGEKITRRTIAGSLVALCGIVSMSIL